MENTRKKLSIVTVNYNNAEGLKKTIQSVLSQTFKDFEYIIIDGGSNDGSREIIQEIGEKTAYWVSEKDGGVYNAMNKGISRSKGEYCYFLNSGDYLWEADTLEKVFNLNPTEDILYGNMIQGGANSLQHGLPTIRFYDFYIGSIYHQAAFIRTGLFETIGLYNEKLKVVSDWEFFLKAIFIHNCTTRYFDVAIASYEIGGLSFQDLEANLRDRKMVLDKYFSRFTEDYSDYDAYKRSDFIGIYRFLERRGPVRFMISSLMAILRFMRFTILGQKRRS